MAASDNSTTVQKSQPGYLLFDFAPPCAFHVLSILIKNVHKRCTNNYLQSRDKTISSLPKLIYHVLSISEYTLEKHKLVLVLMNNLHNRCN